MKPTILSRCALPALILGFSAEAAAMPTFPSRIPNGPVNQCANCHVNPAGGGPRNAFGQAFDGNNRRWNATLADMDSDNDGQTNGEELGDPCGTWSTGAAVPRGTDISLPGNANSTSSDPQNPTCITPDAGFAVDMGFADSGVAPSADAGVIDPGAPPPSDDDEGGCSTTGRRNDLLTWALLAGAAMWMRRRRVIVAR